MEEWNSSQGQSTNYSKLGVRESENWNSHCYSQLVPVVPHLQLSPTQQWELEHSKFHRREERLMLGAIQGGGFAKDIFLNKSMYSQALIHTIQTSSTELSITSACLNPALSFPAIFDTGSAPHHSHTPSSVQREQGLTCDSDIWKAKTFRTLHILVSLQKYSRNGPRPVLAISTLPCKNKYEE